MAGSSVSATYFNREGPKELMIIGLPLSELELLLVLLLSTAIAIAVAVAHASRDSSASSSSSPHEQCLLRPECRLAPPFLFHQARCTQQNAGMVLLALTAKPPTPTISLLYPARGQTIKLPKVHPNM
eukprot:5387163-Amphidinium_carterae.2